MKNIFKIKFHGSDIEIISDSPELIAPARLILAPYENDFSGKDADVVISISSRQNFWTANKINKESDITDKMDRLGRRIYSSGKSVYVTQFVEFPGLSAMYEEKAGQERYDILYTPEFIEKSGDRLYQTGYYGLTLFPIARTLQRKQGFHFLHGGAIDFEGCGIAFCGLQGVGKSTILLKMMHNQNMSFLSDNIYFHDNDRIYCCPETVRLDDKSIDFIAPPKDLLVDTGIESDLNRKMYIINPQRTTYSVEPEIFLIPRFHNGPSGLAEISNNIEDMLMVFNELALEVRSFSQWDASFSVTSPKSFMGQIDTMRSLLKNKRVYQLNIRKGDEPQKLIDLILQRVKN